MCGSDVRIIGVILITALCLNAQQEGLPYEQQDSPRIYIRYEENFGTAKIIWQFSQAVDPESLPIPVIQQEPAAGQAVITLKNLAATSFFGPYKRSVGESYPLDYSISFPDSHQILMQVRTKPFQHLSCAYHYDTYSYVISLSYVAGASGSEDTSLHGTKLSWRNYLVHLQYAVPLAAVLLAVALLLLVLTRRSKRRKQLPPSEKHNTVATTMPPPTAATPPPVPPSEELIKKVVQEKKISYDEAALLLSLSQEDRDVVV